jgi:hypothetical protein
MAFQKGRSKTGGIQKGQKHEKTKQWDQIGDYIVNNGAERIIKYMDTLEGKAFFEAYVAILEYFKPKQKRTENENERDVNITVNESVPNKIIVEYVNPVSYIKD